LSSFHLLLYLGVPLFSSDFFVCGIYLLAVTIVQSSSTLVWTIL